MSLIRDIVVFLCGFLLVDRSIAQVLLLGSCPAVSVVQNLEIDKYLGKWYEAEKYFAIFELGGKCITAEYTDRGNGVVGVTNRLINTLKNNTIDSVTGTATIENPPEGKLLVEFPQSPFPAPYWIVDTDYSSYAVVWGCTDVQIFHLSFAWILTREQQPPASVLEKAYAAIDKNGIERKHFQKTEQKDCPKDY